MSQLIILIAASIRISIPFCVISDLRSAVSPDRFIIASEPES